MPMHLCAVRQLKDAPRLHRILHKNLHFPRSAADIVVRGVKLAINPRQAAVRRRVAEEVRASGADTPWISEDDGYLLFCRDQFAGAADALAAASDLFAERARHGAVEDVQRTANKRFLLSIVAREEFLKHPEILSFMISRPIIDLASRYFGSVPVLSSASLLWTPPNDSLEKSQLFHLDGEDDRQLKLFLNVSDVMEDAGPLTFLPAKISAQVMRRLRYDHGRLTDSYIENAGGTGSYVRITGPAGSGVVLDTSRCLHFGSRNNSVGRLILMFQYTSFYAPKARAPNWASGIEQTGLVLDEVQRLVLGLAPIGVRLS